MPKNIKTREVSRDIKTRNPVPPIGRQMKNAALKAKDTAARQLEAPQGSPENQAGDTIETHAKSAASTAVHTLDSQGRKAVQQTYQRIKQRPKEAPAPDATADSGIPDAGRAPTEQRQAQRKNHKKKQQAQRSNAKQPAKPEKPAAQGDKPAALKQKAKKQKPGRTVGRSKNVAKTAQQSARQGQQAAKTAAKSAKTARQTAQRARQATEQAVKRSKDAVKATWKIIKATYEGTKAIVMAIAAGGWVAVVIIIFICLVGFFLASPLGIFFSGGGNKGEKTIPQVVQELTREYYDRYELLKYNHVHDVLDINGTLTINWPAVLAVYAVQINLDSVEPGEVVTLNEKKIEKLRKILYEMNNFTYTISSNAEHQRALTVNVLLLSPGQMADLHRFNKSQRELLEELLSPQYSDMWAMLLGGYTPGSGEILRGDPARVGTDIFAWPMQTGDYYISSDYGSRDDPTNPGTIKHHGGIDLAADEGVPILAATDGVVITANSTDSWGDSYGYYVKVRHEGGYETMYAHCSIIGVREGEEVHQGQVIAWVGSTGNSTGPHLHFEVRKDGNRVNPLQFFISE